MTGRFRAPRLAARAQLTELVSALLRVDTTNSRQGSPRGPAAPGDGNIQAHKGWHSATMNVVTGAVFARKNST